MAWFFSCVYICAGIRIYLCGKNEWGGEYARYIPFLKNKIRRLLVPYAFTAAVWVVPISQHFFHKDMLYLLKKYVLCIYPSQLWFLWMLFGVFAASWPLWKIFSENVFAGAAAAIAFYCAGVAGDMILPNIYCIWSSCQNILLFYIGIRIWKREENETQLIYRIRPQGWFFIDIIIFAVYEFLKTKNGFSADLNLVVLPLLHAAGSIMAFVSLQSIAACASYKSSRTFRLLASYSMPVYLFHQQIIYFVICWLNGKVNPYVHLCINFAAGVVGALAISAVLMKFKITRILIGEKQRGS